MNKSEALLTALESQNWKAVNRIVASLPSHLPKNSDSSSVTASLEAARSAADTLLQACDFRTTFELSFATRKALINIPSILSWAAESLRGFSFDEHVIARIAAMLGALGMGSFGRTEVGCSGAVDQLTIVWDSHPTCIDVVKALASLCSGHIDNVSRTMRRRGVSIAIRVLSNEENREYTVLLEQTLVYIGLCAICTPDMAREEKALVPALLVLLEDKLNVRRPHLLQHVLMALGNIVDCWTKEGFGYDLGDESRLVDAILNAWRSLKRSRDIASSSSWALGSMLVGEGTESKAFQGRFAEVKALAELWKLESKTCDFLYTTAEKAIRNRGAERKRTDTRAPKGYGDRPKCADSSQDYFEEAPVSVGTRRGTGKRRRPSVSRENTPPRSMEDSTIISTTCEHVQKVVLSPVSHCNSSSDDEDYCGQHTVPDARRRTTERVILEGSRQTSTVVNDTPKPRSTKRKLSSIVLSKNENGSGDMRRSKRQRTPSVKLSQTSHVQIQKRHRRAQRLDIEIIEISSDSETEKH